MPDKSTSDQLLGSTSRWTAGARARESLRPDRLFHDPWAAALAAQEGSDWVNKSAEDAGGSIIVRTHHFDDFLERVTNRNAIRQVVLIAAGLDTRAFRLDWPEHCRLFELDQAPILAYKDRILSSAGAQPTCERQTVPIDLTSTWKETFLKTDFDPLQPSAWLIEGILFYLPNERVTQLIDEVTSLTADGSWVGFDIINSAFRTSPWTQQRIERLAHYGTPWIGTMDDPDAFLSARGWHATCTNAVAQEEKHDRPRYPILPSDVTSDKPYHWFVTAQKTKNT
jgi:methyltransferase (TIGR00027 family)